jgi:hypothetical protein
MPWEENAETAGSEHGAAASERASQTGRDDRRQYDPRLGRRGAAAGRAGSRSGAAVGERFVVDAIRPL